MVLTGEKRKEYDRKRYAELKAAKPRAEPKQTNLINRPETYNKRKEELKIIETRSGPRVADDQLDTVRGNLIKIYGEEHVDTLIQSLAKVSCKKQGKKVFRVIPGKAGQEDQPVISNVAPEKTIIRRKKIILPKVGQAIDTGL